MDPQDAGLLIARARGGDRAAFDELARRARPRIEAVLGHRLGSREEIDELVQETFLRAFRAFDRFHGQDESAFGRWSNGIAVNVAREAMRRGGETRAEPLDLEVPAKEPSPSKGLRREERFDRLQAALSALSPDHRRVLLLVRVEGLSIQETAKRMDRSPNAVSHLLLRASRELRSAFGDTASLRLPDRQLEDRGGRDVRR